MDKRKIRGKDILRDIRAGADDATLMNRYALSAQALQSVFNKLVKAGMISHTELEERLPAGERTVDIGLFICPACGNIQAAEFPQCPRCGFVHPGQARKAPHEEPRRTPSKVVPAAKSQPSKPTAIQKLEQVTIAPKPAHDNSLQESVPELHRIVRYCRILGFTAAVCCLLLLAAVLGASRLSPLWEALPLGQSLVALAVLGIPLIIIVFMIAVSLRALSESVKVFLRVSRSHGQGS